MLKSIRYGLLPVLAVILFASFTIAGDDVDKDEQTANIEWIGIEEAFELNNGNKKKHHKKILIDFYTDWCGWCKRMDQTTFSNPQLVEYINENYHAVKFDAEQRDELTVDGKTYGFRPGGRRGGTHELALALAVHNSRIGYPTLAILDEDGTKLLTAPGYKTAQQLDVLLNYYGSDHHRDLDLEAFKRVYSSPIK